MRLLRYTSALKYVCPVLSEGAYGAPLDYHYCSCILW